MCIEYLVSYCIKDKLLLLNVKQTFNNNWTNEIINSIFLALWKD